MTNTLLVLQLTVIRRDAFLSENLLFGVFDIPFLSLYVPIRVCVHCLNLDDLLHGSFHAVFLAPLRASGRGTGPCHARVSTGNHGRGQHSGPIQPKSAYGMECATHTATIVSAPQHSSTSEFWDDGIVQSWRRHPGEFFSTWEFDGIVSCWG